METKRLRGHDGGLLAETVRRLIPAADRHRGVASPAHLRRALEEPRNYFIVCLNDTTPIGYLSAFQFPAIGVDRHCVYLYDVIVEPDSRRLGVASKMIETLQMHCKENGVDHIWVGTSLDNEVAQRTFETTGARKVGETYVEYTYELDATS